MEDTLKSAIQTAMVNAMRAQEKEKLGTIRLIQAAIKQKEVDERVVVTDNEILKLLDKMIRQRRDSIEHFELAKRNDLVEKELREIEVIQAFLPTPLSANEIKELVLSAIQETGAKEIRDMAKVMALLKPKLQGRADMGEVGTLIKNQLASS